MSGLDVEEVIVVVKHNGRFRWYKSDRDLWVLDLNKWTKEFLDAGFQVPESDPAERFGIPVVNDETAGRFLAEMEQFEISKDDLSKELVARFPSAQSWWEVGDLFPIMFVDFDRKHVCAFYPQGTRMERYIPDGWTSEFEDFLTKYSEEYFPRREKFWVRDGLDMLKELNERGQRLSQQQQ
jgi:hypothetical protein